MVKQNRIKDLLAKYRIKQIDLCLEANLTTSQITMFVGGKIKRSSKQTNRMRKALIAEGIPKFEIDAIDELCVKED